MHEVYRLGVLYGIKHDSDAISQLNKRLHRNMLRGIDLAAMCSQWRSRHIREQLQREFTV